MKKIIWTKWRIIRRIWITGAVIFMTWMYLSMQADVDDNLFSDTSEITVEETADFTVFTPKTEYKKVMFFYPGALVDPAAYAPLCRKIAEKCLQVYIIHMPWRLAIFGYEKIKELHLLADKTRQYILAGHSQGAKMAAQFVYENPAVIDKLILLGTTHPRDFDLSGSSIPVLKIYASLDGIATPEKVIVNKTLLPPATQLVCINGGNHSQFGYYGFQLGDSQATLSREDQQKIIFDNIISFIY